MTISERTVLIATERGVITPHQAERLRALEVELAPGTDAAIPQPDDDERLRFITGFGDIFVTIGLALFLGALGYFAEAVGAAAMWATVGAASWLLAEFFTRVQRMALPSIVLLVVFCASVFMASSAWFGVIEPLIPSLLSLSEDPLVLVLAGLATLAAAMAHYWRFRVPITIAAAAAALVAIVVGLVAAMVPGGLAAAINPVLMLCGLSVFALAMRFDMSDPQRLTRRTDIAFWLHLLAAPLIVHPLIRGFIWPDGAPGEGNALPMLAVFAGLGVIAVLIDRRALLVSGLAYAGIAFASLIKVSGFSGSATPLTIFVLGAFILLLSALWHPLRRAVLALLPAGLARRLPNPNVLPTTRTASSS
ncbi:hypothetical protein EV667_0048 [Ancylobacter aquaticus]|uniref:DUF2157 domain-containing protein n=1 Tax=Ancylobacter aquaticus TaxID=100 RepID=A0A4R1I7A8_ANCAQ|nr:hypothetical protein [Ancylobacter aquaticus]TCK29963.1 hypothetical protein EV667_0048 [Ancylobacter aquaticus]